jgi:hypothetical protein
MPYNFICSSFSIGYGFSIMAIYKPKSFKLIYHKDTIHYNYSIKWGKNLSETLRNILCSFTGFITVQVQLETLIKWFLIQNLPYLCIA